MRQKSLKTFIFNSLDKGIYLTDSDIYRFRERNEDLFTAELYKKEWHRLQADKEFFTRRLNEGIKIDKITRYKGKYTAQLQGSKFWVKISKAYFNEIKNEFKPDNEFDYLKSKNYEALKRI